MLPASSTRVSCAAVLVTCSLILAVCVPVQGRPKKHPVRDVRFRPSPLYESRLGGNAAPNISNYFSSYIVGGSTAMAGSWPWQASIQYENPAGYWNHYCGGSLVDDVWVVTAAHCVASLESQRLSIRVVLGDSCLSDYTGWEQYRSPSKILMHLYYDPNTTQNDIAMIKLGMPAMGNSHVGVIPIATEDDTHETDNSCYVTGWGRTDGSSQVLSDTLEETSTHVITKSTCRHSLGNTISSSQICAIHETASACTGDSGGPLACQQADGAWVLKGVASWVESVLCEPNHPNVYTRISFYDVWINYVKSFYQTA